MNTQWTRGRTGIAGIVAAAMAASILVANPPGASAAPALKLPAVQSMRSVPAVDVAGRAKPADPGQAAVQRKPATASWPAAGTADATVPATSRARAGNLPVLIGRPSADAAENGATKAAKTATTTAARGAAGQAVPGRARVRVLDRAATDRAGVSGLLFTVAPDLAGTLSVDVDYSSFQAAYGGDWATRLRLEELPACVLTTPERTECRTGTPLPTRNTAQQAKLTADVTMATASTATVLAATAAPAGSAGDYRATSLSASSSWEAGGSAGDFTWSYPMVGSPSFGGPEPDVNLTYSSGSVDGRTVSTNNQSSWVGEGWDLSQGFIERRYKACSDDVTSTPKPDDQCWETDNAFLSTGGRTVELVKDDADKTHDVWRLRSDDGSRVERLPGASNGDNDGEYWRITARDGTQYFYGLNHLPGWSAGKEVTNSTWTSPVFGNDENEKCHASTFAASYCNQAWRWNLDYVVDPNGNAMSLFYTTETNRYGRNRTATDDTEYVRAGYLSRIDYGQRSDTMYSAAAPMQVKFDVEERCAAGATCGTGTITSTTAKNWPDVPYDQNCNKDATCSNLFAPTYWTRKRLKTVTTRVLVSGTTYQDVNAWALGYEFRDPGDGTSQSLWLASITHSGKVGGTLTLPAVTFSGTQLENRVDANTADGIPPLYKWRLTDVYDESGGHVRVNYSGKECTRSALPKPESNTKLCFPQYWVPEGAVTPQQDWFHKYVAKQVLEGDQSGEAGIEETDYEYLDGGAWHYDDNELTPTKYRGWSEWRGFGRVKVTHGAPGEVRSQSETRYMRGMDGDKQASGTRNATVTDSEGVTIDDNGALAGFTRETITYNGVGGGVLDGEINDPWVSAATSTHGSTSAYLTGVAKQRSRLALADGGWRRTEVRTTFDSYGLPSQTYDLGDVAVTTDDECVRDTYARDTSKWMIDFKVRSERVRAGCDKIPTRPDDVISDVRTFFDGSTTFGTAPTEGNASLTQTLASYSGSTPVYAQSTRAEFDDYGRATAEYDALDHVTTTKFTPASGGPTTGSTVTNPMKHVTTTTLEPAWGIATSVVDPNGRRTDVTYDPLGRSTAVWYPDRSKDAKQTPSEKYSYLVRTDEPNVITSETLRDDGKYDVSYEFFDGRLRARQTQEPAAGGGRLIEDSFYDSRGLLVRENTPYWNNETAGTKLAGVTDNTVPNQTRHVYDGDERETAEITMSYGTEKWRSTTTYGGNWTSVDPPAGEPATTTYTDIEGRATELRQYEGGAPTGAYDATKYTYAKGGETATVQDPAGNLWRYTYDLRGRKIEEEDPDKGTSSYTYDNAGQLRTTTDARDMTLAYSYDDLGRRTGVYDGSLSGTKRADWTYDTLANGQVVKGQPATSTRYVDGRAYTTSVNGYDSRYRSLGTTVTIPEFEGKLAGTYQMDTGYTDSGLPQLITYPDAGGMPAETLRYTYDVDGRIKTAQTGLSTLLTDATYTPYDEPSQYTLQTAADKQLVQTYYYDDATRRLERTLVDRTVSPNHLADVNYKYDDSGNLTKIADAPVGGTADTQCFTYDYLKRLTGAWTATNDCATDPSAAILGGPAPYWQSWTYDKTGNRRSETNHNTSTGAGTVSTYSFPAAGSAHPHALASVTTDGKTDSYKYDESGNTTEQGLAGTSEVLTWDAEDHLETATKDGKSSSYVYDADGERLISRDPDSVTLYLDDEELKLTRATGVVSATRYYEIGSVTAVRTSDDGLSFEAADRLGTAQISVNAQTLAVTQRRFLPFGESRGAAPTTWPTTKGYVGGTVDPLTGLTHLGAREYDPNTGRFLSVDPIIDHDDPQQMNGYAYASNTPVTMHDPDGQYSTTPTTGWESKDPPKSKPHKSSPVGNRYCPCVDYSAGQQRFLPGDQRKQDMTRQAEAERLAREYAAKKRREEQARKAKEAQRKAKKKNSCKWTSFWSSACRKAAGNAVKAAGHGIVKGLKAADESGWLSVGLSICSIVVAVACGVGAAIVSGYDAYKDFKNGDWRSGTLNLLSGATGGAGAAFAKGSKVATRAANRALARGPVPRATSRARGAAVISHRREVLGHTRNNIFRGDRSNQWGIASFGLGVTNAGVTNRYGLN